MALQGRGRRRRRARRRPPGDPQLRPHPGPCPRGGRSCERGRERARESSFATARRWRSASCSRPSSPTAWAGSARRASSVIDEVVAGYDLPIDAPAGADAGHARRLHDPGQEVGRRPHLRARRPATASSRCSDVSAELVARGAGGTGRRSMSPDAARRRRAPASGPAALVGPEPRPSRRAPAGDLRHRRRSPTTSPGPREAAGPCWAVS